MPKVLHYWMIDPHVAGSMTTVQNLPPSESR